METYTHEQYTLTLDVAGYSCGRTQVAYVLKDNKGIIFSGSDLSSPPSFDPEGPKSVEALLSFLTLREDDIEEEYFENYTERQIEFRDCEAEDLYRWQEELNPEMYA